MAIDSGHFDLPSHNRFFQRNRQVYADIVAVTHQMRVLADFERHHCVAIAAGAGLALAGNADLLARDDALGQLELDRLAVAQTNALWCQRRCIGKRYQMFISDVCALGRRSLLRARPRALLRPAAAKQAIKNIAEIDPAAATKIEIATAGTTAL